MTELEIQWNKSEIGSEIPKKILFMAFQTKSQDLLDLYSQTKNLSISSFFFKLKNIMFCGDKRNKIFFTKKYSLKYENIDMCYCLIITVILL